MKYICKRELDKLYEVKASFYRRQINGKNIVCRRAADIMKRGCESEVIDAYFIMMNPGSCKLKDENKIAENENEEMEFIDAKSDATMARVMNIMEELGWKYVRMLNLSDFVDGNSQTATKRVAGFTDDEFDGHSIFSKARRSELLELTKIDALYIKAWGCSKSINYYAPYALEFLEGKQSVGAKNGELNFLHIKPPMVKQQVEIADKLISQIKAL